MNLPNNPNYARLCSMAELRAARMQLNREIAYREQRLESDYHAVKRALSFAGLVSSMMEKIDVVRSFFIQIYDGYLFARSFFDRKQEPEKPQE